MSLNEDSIRDLSQKLNAIRLDIKACIKDNPQVKLIELINNPVYFNSLDRTGRDYYVLLQKEKELQENINYLKQ